MTLGAAFLAQGVEESLEGGVVEAASGPHQPTGAVVDHHRQIAVASLVGDPDPDPARAGIRSCRASTSAKTRVIMIAPTVRQAIRIAASKLDDSVRITRVTDFRPEDMEKWQDHSIVL